MRRVLLTVMAVALATSVALVTTGSMRTQEPASAFSPVPAGAAPLVEEARSVGHDVTRLVSGPLVMAHDSNLQAHKALLVIVQPQRGYSADEVDAVRQFLEQGGRVLVADNFGQSNSLIGGLGASLERVRLVEPERAPLTLELLGSEYEVGMPHPTALRLLPQAQAQVIGNTSDQSFLDRNGDGIIGEGDPPGPFVVGARLRVGEGELLVLSDPSVLLQGFEAGPDDAQFRLALLRVLLPETGRVIIDESREPTPDPWLRTATAIVGAAGVWPWNAALAAGATVVLALAALLRDRQAWRRHESNPLQYHPRAPTGESQPQAEDRPARVRWTRRGHAAVFGGIALGVAGLLTDSETATYFAAFLLSVAVVAFLAPPARVTATRAVSTEYIDEDGEFRVNLSVSARGGRSGHVELLETLPKAIALDQGSNWFQVPVARHATFDVQLDCRAELRGHHRIGPIQVRSLDGFALRVFEMGVGDTSDLWVRPRNDPLGRIPFRSKIPQITLGPHLVNRAGDGTEFHALRPYQSGDSIRIVNWKASARSKDLVVNQRVHESMATITIFVDARAVSAAGVARHTPLNEGCRAAMSIVSGAINARDKVRVFAYGDGLHELTAGSSHHEPHEIGDMLAELKPAGDTSFETAVNKALPGLRSRSPVILISGFEADETVVAGLLRLRQRTMLPVAIAMTIQARPAKDDPAQAEPDADALDAARSHTIAAIHAAGIPVVSAVPGMPLPILLRYGVA